MDRPSPEKLAEWQSKAAKKNAIVPIDFLVYPDRAVIVCGRCKTEFSRNLIPNLNEPTFACPSCNQRNWLPVTFKLNKSPYSR